MDFDKKDIKLGIERIAVNPFIKEETSIDIIDKQVEYLQPKKEESVEWDPNGDPVNIQEEPIIIKQEPSIDIVDEDEIVEENIPRKPQLNRREQRILYKRNQRLAETPEEHERRLEWHRQQRRRRKEKETSEQREYRLVQQRARLKKFRDKIKGETADEREVRLKVQREKYREKRIRKQKPVKSIKDRLRLDPRGINIPITPEELKEYRRVQLNLYNRNKRKTETIEARKRRLEQQRTYKEKMKLTETPEKREKRLLQQREWYYKYMENETAEEKEMRKKKDRDCYRINYLRKQKKERKVRKCEKRKGFDRHGSTGNLESKTGELN